MLNPESEWWKYISIEKLRTLLDKIPSNVVYITPTKVRELGLLDDRLELIGIISLSQEDIEIYK